MVRILIEKDGTITAQAPDLGVDHLYTGPACLTFDSVLVSPSIGGVSAYSSGVIYVNSSGVAWLQDSRTPEFYLALYVLVPFAFLCAFRLLLK